MIAVSGGVDAAVDFAVAKSSSPGDSCVGEDPTILLPVSLSL